MFTLRASRSLESHRFVAIGTSESPSPGNAIGDVIVNLISGNYGVHPDRIATLATRPQGHIHLFTAAAEV